MFAGSKEENDKYNDSNDPEEEGDAGRRSKCSMMEQNNNNNNNNRFSDRWSERKYALITTLAS
jgi:hypothetical protein